MTEIIPDMWISGKDEATDYNFLKAKKIRLLINCTKDIDYCEKYIAKYEPDTVRIPIDDKPNLSKDEDNRILYNKLHEITETINNYLCKGKPVLIYCYAGRQRSASVAAAYLMRYGNMQYNAAVSCICTKRLRAFSPAINFDNALINFSDNLYH